MKKNYVKILEIDVGENNDAWYYCSDGKTYYDQMYSFDNKIGDEINTSNYIEC